MQGVAASARSALVSLRTAVRRAERGARRGRARASDQRARQACRRHRMRPPRSTTTPSMRPAGRGGATSGSATVARSMSAPRLTTSRRSSPAAPKEAQHQRALAERRAIQSARSLQRDRRVVAPQPRADRRAGARTAAPARWTRAAACTPRTSIAPSDRAARPRLPVVSNRANWPRNSSRPVRTLAPRSPSWCAKYTNGAVEPDS